MVLAPGCSLDACLLPGSLAALGNSYGATGGIAVLAPCGVVSLAGLASVHGSSNAGAGLSGLEPDQLSLYEWCS